MGTLLLTASDVRRALTMAAAVTAIEEAFAAHGRAQPGEVNMPPKLYLELPSFDGDFRAMPAQLGDAAGVKWVNVHPKNPSRFGLPSVMGMYILNDPNNALPLAVMDATEMTAFRTGAAGAVASKYLFGENAPRRVGFIGAGVQARHLLSAHRVVYGEGFEVLVADAHEQAAEHFVQSAGGRAVSVEEAAGADIVCTATPSRTPVVLGEWLSGRTHLNAMGADAAGKRELDTATLRGAAIYVDDRAQAFHSGEVNVPLETGEITAEDIAGTLGAVVTGAMPAPVVDVTVFDSTGLALQDVALARVIHEASRAMGLGATVDFRA